MKRQIVTKILKYRGPSDPTLGGISLVLPVHNESFIIEQTLRNYLAELQPRVKDLEIIVSEDGSIDDTKAVLERLEKELPIRLFMSNERKGYQKALVDAISFATKPWLFIVDSDYQFAAIDFWRLDRYRATHDVILGNKSPRRDPYYRVMLSQGYNYLLRTLCCAPYYDMDTGFRLIRKEWADTLKSQVQHMSFFTAEFVVRAHHKGARIIEVPVPHYARKIGSSNIFYLSSLFMICFRQFIGLLKLRQELKSAGFLPHMEQKIADNASLTEQTILNRHVQSSDAAA